MNFDDLKLIELEEGMEESFDQMVAESPCSGFHQSLIWSEVCALDGLNPQVWLLTNANEVVASAMFLSIGEGEESYLYCPDGPILDWSDENSFELMEFFFKAVLKKRGLKSVMFKARLLAGKLDFASRYKKYRGDLESKATRIIDLEPSPDEILANMRGSGRRMVRIAERKGVKIKKEINKKTIQAFYNIYEESAKRNEFRPKSYESIENLCLKLKERQQGKLFVAYSEEAPLAAAIITHYGPVASYFLAGTSQEGQDTRAIFLLIWEAIQDAKETGHKVFDFGGITLEENNTWTGFSKFKEKFGGRILDFEGKYIFEV